MKQLFYAAVAAATLTGAMNATAAQTKPLLKDFAVYVKQDIRYSTSDFEGNIGAGGEINVRDFLFNSRKCVSCESSFTGILTGKNFTMQRGTVKTGMISAAGDVFVSNMTIAPANHAPVAIQTPGNVEVNAGKIVGDIRASDYSASRNSRGYYTDRRGRVLLLTDTEAQVLSNKLKATVADLNSQMDDLSAKSARMPSRSVISSGSRISLSATEAVNVFTVESSALSSASVITFSGDENSSFVINVVGSNVRMSYVGLSVGKVNPKNILWNFPNATHLTIMNSGTPDLGCDGRVLGIPGTILAPNADVDFFSALVTGSILAKSLNGMNSSSGMAGGQVNDPAPCDPTHP